MGRGYSVGMASGEGGPITTDTPIQQQERAMPVATTGGSVPRSMGRYDPRQSWAGTALVSAELN